MGTAVGASGSSMSKIAEKLAEAMRLNNWTAAELAAQLLGMAALLVLAATAAAIFIIMEGTAS